MIILAVICLGIVAGMGLMTLVEDIRAEWKLIKKERER